MTASSGFINVNKPSGVTSAHEVAAARRLVGMPCGHMGTLDPMAEGVLPVGIGNACRLFDYFLGKRKRYIATFRFGISTDTLDTTGKIERSDGRIPGDDEVEGVLREFTGDILQVPPRYSAKNIGGKRGYELAREGRNFDIPAKAVRIFSLSSKRISVTDYEMTIECGGGTYVRSLARDIGERLGTCAAMAALTRTECGVFRIEDAVRLSDLDGDSVDGHIIPTDSVLPYDSLHPDKRDEEKLRNGVAVRSERGDGTYKVYFSDGFYGLGEIEKSLLRMRTKLC